MVTTWREGDWEVHCETSGGRLNQVRWRGRELLTDLHLPGGLFRPPAEKWGLYETRPVFGYDDCWPSLDPSPWPGRDAPVRDHGELCWQEWEVAATPEGLTCVARSADGTWAFTRCISVRGAALQLDFACAGTGERPQVSTWAGHALVPPSAVRALRLPHCARISLDYSTGAEGPEVSGLRSQRLWSYLQALALGEAVMFVLHDTAASSLSLELDGLCWEWLLSGVARPALGLWYNRRGYPNEGDLARDEFGVEWMFAGPTRLADAAERGLAVTIPPGETYRWSLRWVMSALS